MKGYTLATKTKPLKKKWSSFLIEWAVEGSIMSFIGRRTGSIYLLLVFAGDSYDQEIPKTYQNFSSGKVDMKEIVGMIPNGGHASPSLTTETMTWLRRTVPK